MLKKQLVPPSMGGTGAGERRAYRVGDDRGKYLKQQGENDYANQRTGRKGRGGGGAIWRLETVWLGSEPAGSRVFPFRSTTAYIRAGEKTRV